MPHLARLVEQGVRSELATLEPTVSPAIWTTIATGMRPERHGILGFDGIPGRTMRTLPQSGMRRVPAFWNMLPDRGVSVGVAGWWVTWPAEEVPEGSWIVSDRVPYTRMEAAIHREQVGAEDTFPPSLLHEIFPLVESPGAIDPKAIEEFLGLGRLAGQFAAASPYRMGRAVPEFVYVYQSDRSTLKIARALARERPTDVLAVYLTGIDTLSHLFWHWAFPEDFPQVEVAPAEIERLGSVIPRYYALVDDYLGELIEAVGEGARVVVLSDHGFGPTGHLPWSGGHGRITPGAPIAPPGVLVMAGPGLASGVTLDEAHVVDVLPTLLALLGQPVADDMPGRVLRAALADPAQEIRRLASYGERTAPGLAEDPEGDAERLERLRALGYVGGGPDPE
jgi:arylsulfatase A-like enzyme